ncbi:MAG TPA: methionyl-tRNA formyltransferase [Syntrophorhabdaceae bacterium]|jgi:methionyl-tRNA formyltransferase|nr:methionyl-tRNA formyltransferase [Syntrophorhabdaceae bacterium]HOS05536.1 methionyl-tRNA formyltransferase [Syntrophorhabdaceae bacterium]HPH42481.1 methionyl-tRNA formyltransferase [Syntrophorhabdaceae bacterium]HQM77356.1 methionyl-tRNA formyltransferase [Syntrophorhabdaceae bacterium]
MNVIFFGSSSFSVLPLKSISQSVSAVVTKKAKPKGRGYVFEDNEVKKAAYELNLPIIEIESFRDEASILIREYKPDLFVVASFGIIIPRWVLDIPSMGAINIHPSLLPKYRGPSPIQWALLNRDEKTGITLINMNEKMDAGNIVYQEDIDIDGDDDFIILSERLSRRSAEIMLDMLSKIEVEGMPEGIEQQHEVATFTKIITKEMGKIDWNKTAAEIAGQIKAFVLWPTAFSFFDDMLFKIFDGKIFYTDRKKLPGTILEVIKDGIVVQSSDRAILVKEVQLQNKKRMRAFDFANGYRGLVGKILK